MPNLMEMLLKNLLRTFALHLDFLKVVRLVFWSGVVGPGTNVKLSLASSLAFRAHCRATSSKARLVSKSILHHLTFSQELEGKEWTG